MSKVLVVESHRGLRNAILKLLEGMGIEPIEASGTEEIYRYDIDLVITDAANGKDLPDTTVPVLVISPSAKDNDKNVHYIRQPFEVGELCNTVMKLTRQCVG